MSARSDNATGRVPAAVLCAALVACALLLAGCGGTAPARPTDPSADAARTVAPEAATAEPSRERDAPTAVEPEPQAVESSRREQRRAREAAEAAVAAGDLAAPIPEDVAAAHERAVAAMASESWLDAVLELEQLVAEHPEYPGPHVNLAIVYMHDGRVDEARAALDKALAIDPMHAAANNQLGMLLRREGAFAEAEAAYRRAIATDPDYTLAHYNLGVLLDLYLRRPAEALECYELYQTLLTEPNQTVGRWIVDLRRRLGLTDNATRVARETGE